MMASGESEGCLGPVDKHMSWNGKWCGVESFCGLISWFPL